MLIRPCGPSAERSPGTKRRRTAPGLGEAGHQGAPGGGLGPGPSTWERAGAVDRRRRRPEAGGRPERAKGRGEREALPRTGPSWAFPSLAPCGHHLRPCISLAPAPWRSPPPLPPLASLGVIFKRLVNTSSPSLHTVLPTPKVPWAQELPLRTDKFPKFYIITQRASSKATEINLAPPSSLHTPHPRPASAPMALGPGDCAN